MALRIGRTTNRVLALDWDARNVRAVVVRQRGDDVEVVKAASIPVDADVSLADPESFGRYLSRALDRAGITVRQAAITVPRDRVVLNTLKVPPTPDDELPAVVQYQMIKELPFGPEEATMDFAVLSADASVPRDALVAALRNDVLEHYQSVARAAGLKLMRIGLRPWANLLAASAGVPDLGRGRTLFVDIGPELTEIDIICDGQLAFSRAAVVRLPDELIAHTSGGVPMEDSRIMSLALVDVGVQDLGVQRALDELLIEVTRSVEAYRATATGARLDRIVIAGATGLESAFAEVVGERFEAPSELYNPARAIDLSPERARELRGFSSVLGLAMAEGRPALGQIDFLQPKKTVARRTRQIQKARLVAAVAVVFAAAGYLWFEYTLSFPRGRITSLQTSIAKLKKTERAYILLRRKMNSLEHWVESERLWTDELLQLTRAFPDNTKLYVTGMTMSDAWVRDMKGSADLSLRAKDSTLSHDLIQRLRAAGPFEAVLENSQEQPQRDGFTYSERMVVSYTSKGTERPAAARPASEQPEESRPSKAAAAEAKSSTTGDVRRAARSPNDVAGPSASTDQAAVPALEAQPDKPNQAAAPNKKEHAAGADAAKPQRPDSSNATRAQSPKRAERKQLGRAARPTPKRPRRGGSQ